MARWYRQRGTVSLTIVSYVWFFSFYVPLVYRFYAQTRRERCRRIRFVEVAEALQFSIFYRASARAAGSLILALSI